MFVANWEWVNDDRINYIFYGMEENSIVPFPLMIPLHDSMFVGHIRGQIRQCVLGGGDAPSPLLCPPHCVVNEFAPPHLQGLHRSPGLTWLRGARRSRSSLTPSTLLSPSGALRPMPSTAQSVRTRSCVGICSGTPFPSPKTQYLRPEQCAMVPARGVTRCLFTREREQSLVRTSTRIQTIGICLRKQVLVA